jgi:hypothetical protein
VSGGGGLSGIDVADDDKTDVNLLFSLLGRRRKLRVSGESCGHDDGMWEKYVKFKGFETLIGQLWP